MLQLAEVAPSDYELLAECIRSDQLSAEQLIEVMQDTSFAEWYAEHFGDNK